jgi:hypothetical protein
MAALHRETPNVASPAIKCAGSADRMAYPRSGRLPQKQIIPGSGVQANRVRRSDTNSKRLSVLETAHEIVTLLRVINGHARSPVLV